MANFQYQSSSKNISFSIELNPFNPFIWTLLRKTKKGLELVTNLTFSFKLYLKISFTQIFTPGRLSCSNSKWLLSYSKIAYMLIVYPFKSFLKLVSFYWYPFKSFVIF